MRGPRSSAARSRRAGRRSRISGPSSVVPHASLDEYLRSLPAGDCLGDNHRCRSSHATRVTFQNVNGVPEDGDHVKQRQINSWLKDERVGIALLAEAKTFWPSIPEGQGWNDRMRQVTRKADHKGFYSSVAFNKHQKRSAATTAFQWGGCIATVFNQVSHRAKEGGRDSTGLGRWSYVRLQGKKLKAQGGNDSLGSMSEVNEATRRPISRDLVVVSAYRPSREGTGESTVWAQHRLYFNSINRKVDPRKAFVDDICKQIQQWRDEGCEVLLGIDANEDISVNSPDSIRQRFRECGLDEAILKRYPPTATHQRNQSNVAIDGIFTTSGVPVLAGGYYAFDEFVEADHRALWIDIDLTAALGNFKPQESSFKPRKLSLMDSRSVKRYLQLVHSGYEEYDIPARLTRLNERLDGNYRQMSSSLARKYNCLHQQMYMIRRLAEDNCRTTSSGKVPWSPKLQGFWDRMSLWKLLLKSRKRCRVSSRKIRRLMKKTRLHDAWRKTTAELEEALLAERGAYKNAKRQAPQLRRDFLTAQTQDATKKKWKSQKAHDRFLRLRRMKQREEARRRRRAQQKGSTGGLRAIQVEETVSDGSTRLRTITERSLVEEGCMQENAARYDQTRAPYITPPMAEPLYTAFTGAEAETNSMALLEGRYALPDLLDPATKSFLSHCRFHKDHSPVHLEVTTADHVHFWSRIPEDKGSEPHGLHNGHFKAAAQSPVLAYCDALFRNIPLSTGFVPLNWQNLMNFAIEKKAGDFRLSKMRTIQLMNSEAQANNKKAGRAAMRYAEEHSLIPDGQCGSRKRHQAIDLALSKRLVWDLLILQRRAAGWISNDAKSCFDRVVHWVAIVAMLRFGLTWRVLSSMFNMLSSATHRVRTGFGDSERSFKPPSVVPFQGCGQGNGAGPPIWISVSSVLITMMEAMGYGFECLSALESQLVTAQCFCFVDDTDVIEAGNTVHHSGESICASVQDAATLWAGGIRATGGAINPEKSFWWLIDFDWDSRVGKWKFRRKRAVAPDFELQIEGLSGAIEPLRRLEPDESERTLGVMLAPLENLKAHEAQLIAKAKDWAEQLRPNLLHKYDVLPLIRSTIMKKLEYPMALTTLDAKQWTDIMSPVLQVCLPKAGVCRNFPRAVVFAPLSYQGLGLPHPFGCQVFKHLEMLLRHMANRTKTGGYMEANFQAHQLETGTSFGILQQVYNNTAILASDTWMKRVWHELEGLDIYVACDSPALSHRCEDDSLLVDLFINLEVDQDELLWLNWCRMFLQVCTVSDIVTADGRFIRRSIWDGQRDECCRSPYQWPRTVRPGRQHWELWQNTLSRALLASNGPHHPLQQSLGHWTDPLESWNWLISPSLGLFHRQGATWKHLPLEGSSSTSRRYAPVTTPSPSPWWTAPLPTDVLRATVHSRSGSDRVLLTGTGYPSVSPSLPGSSILHAWQTASELCSDYYGWVPDEIEVHGDESTLVAALLEGRLRVISDGSFKNELGTAAVQLLAKNAGSDRIIIRCQTPGLPQDQSPYRSELIGLLAGIMAVDWLLKEWAPNLLTHPRVRIACDGLSAIEMAFEDRPLSPTDAQFDLVSSIREAILRSSADWSPQHVYGHLDKSNLFDELSWWEKRNLEVDGMAVEYRRELEAANHLIAPNSRFFTELAALFVADTKQSRLDPQFIQECVTLPALRERWRDKGTVTAEAESVIAWDTLGRAMRSLPAGLQRWSTKHCVGMCGTGKFKVLWGLETSAACPRCGDFEDHLHVPRCRAASATSEWDRRTAAFSSWLDLQLTGPSIKKAILQLLHGVRDPTSPSARTISPLARPAFLAQQVIGYQGLLEGRIASAWLPLQQQHYDEIRCRRSVSLWASRLSQQLISIGFYMWEQRNSIQHSDDNLQLRERHRTVNEGIHSQFDMGPDDLPPEIRPMLTCRRRVLRKSLVDKEEWLKLLRQERRDFRRSMKAQRRSLRTLFSPSP